MSNFGRKKGENIMIVCDDQFGHNRFMKKPICTKDINMTRAIAETGVFYNAFMRQAGVPPNYWDQLVHKRRSPIEHGDWWIGAKRIAFALGKNCSELWPDYAHLVEPKMISLGNMQVYRVQFDKCVGENRENRKMITWILKTYLTDREYFVVTRRCGFYDGDEWTFSKMSKALLPETKWYITIARIAQLFNKAIRKLRRRLAYDAFSGHDEFYNKRRKIFAEYMRCIVDSWARRSHAEPVNMSLSRADHRYEGCKCDDE